MSNTADQNLRELVNGNESSQKSSPTRRVAADSSDFELMERSQAFLEIVKQVEHASLSDAPVLLIGAPGTGKKIMACAIHQGSARSARPFVPVNCAAPADSLETELFGEAPDRPGSWEQADGGTLFLGEIAETGPPLQARILQALQTGLSARRGADETRPVNVRVIASSSRSLTDEVMAGRFSNDLFLALNATPIILTPRAPQVADYLNQPLQLAEQPLADEWVTLSEIEGRYVARVLNHTGGNKQAAARVLSIDRKTLDRMIKRHHIICTRVRQRAKTPVSS